MTLHSSMSIWPSISPAGACSRLTILIFYSIRPARIRAVGHRSLLRPDERTSNLLGFPRCQAIWMYCLSLGLACENCPSELFAARGCQCGRGDFLTFLHSRYGSTRNVSRVLPLLVSPQLLSIQVAVCTFLPNSMHSFAHSLIYVLLACSHAGEHGRHPPTG